MCSTEIDFSSEVRCAHLVGIALLTVHLDPEYGGPLKPAQ
jgi:hypothetical protein